MGPSLSGGCHLVWNTARTAVRTLPGCQESTTGPANLPVAPREVAAILSEMSAGNVVRITVVLAAVVAAAGSATSSSNDGGKNNNYAGAQNAPATPPPPQQM